MAEAFLIIIALVVIGAILFSFYHSYRTGRKHRGKRS